MDGGSAASMDVSMLKAKFKELDRDGNGTLGLQELGVLLRKGNPDMTEREIRLLHAALDHNQTGRVPFNVIADFVCRTTRSMPGELSPQALTTSEAKHAGWTGAAKVEKYGMCSDIGLVATLPFTVASHIDKADLMLTVCNVYHSASITKTVHDFLQNRQVAGLEGAKHGDIVDIVLNRGDSRVYVYGGFLRDLFCGVVSEDMDYLFRAPGGSLVPFLKTVAEARGWPVYRNLDERTDQSRMDFIAIGDRDKRLKWSAHPCGTGCEGDFCMNSMIYDIKTGSLMDTTGQGIHDSVNYILRHNRGSFAEWVNEDKDRMPGMKLMRYFNFISRGFTPNEADFRNNVVVEAMKVFAEELGQATASNFFQTKVFIGDASTALSKEAAFRTAVVNEFTKSGAVTRSESMAWYLKNFAPLYKPLLVGDMENQLLANLQKDAEGVCEFTRPW